MGAGDKIEKRHPPKKKKKKKKQKKKKNKKFVVFALCLAKQKYNMAQFSHLRIFLSKKKASILLYKNIEKVQCISKVFTKHVNIMKLSINDSSHFIKHN
jgi:hypothetical protein